MSYRPWGMNDALILPLLVSSYRKRSLYRFQGVKGSFIVGINLLLVRLRLSASGMFLQT